MPEPTSDRSQKAGGGAAATANAPRRLPVPAGRGATLIAGGEIHFRDLDLAAGDLLEAVAEQRGVDLVLRLVDPEGRVVVEVDSPTGARGPEELVEIAVTAGRYRLEIVAPGREDAVGEYVLRTEMRRAATGEDRALVEADRALHRGRRLVTGGEHRAAVEALREALVGFRRLGAIRRQAYTAVRLIDAYRNLGENELAYHYAAAAADASRQCGDLPLAAEAGRLAGWLLLRLGEPDGAVPALEEALELFEALGDARGGALAAANLGAARFAVGRLESALASYEDALGKIRVAGDPAVEAAVLTDLADVWLALNRPDDALEASSAARDLYVRLERPLDAATASIGVARASLQLGDLPRAERAAAAAVAALNAGPDDRLRIVALTTLGAILRHQGEFDRARPALERAAGFAAANGDARREAHALLELGKLRLEDGDPTAALEIEIRALERFVEAGDPLGQASARVRGAEALRALGRDAEAWALIEPALDAVERVRAETSRSDARGDYFAFRQEYFENALDLLMALHEREPAAGHHVNAFLLNERRLARGLIEALEAGPEAAIPERLREREGRAMAELRDAAAADLAGTAGEDRIRRLIQELHRARSDSRQARLHDEAERLRPVPVKEVQESLLDPGTLLLVYAQGTERSYLWAISRGEVGVHALAPAATIDALAGRFRATLLARPARLRASSRGAAGRELSDALLGPVASRLDARRLVVVAGGALQAIPFAALPEPGGGPEGDALIRRREIVVLPSVTALASLRRLARERGGREVRVAALADPVFRREDPRVTAASAGADRLRPPAPSETAPGWPEAGRRRVSATAVGDRGRRELVRSAAALGVDPFERLEHSRAEAEAILALAPGHGHWLATGFEASREAVTGGALKGYTVLHVAAHGLLHPRHPELSGLVLSLVDERGRPVDGFLRSFEISGLELDADLVVLSACETALGSEVRGEGMLSLARSFFAAGSPRVIGTLWRVSDRSTSTLMTAFYTEHLRRGLPAAAALREAQLAALAHPATSDPYHWAGFVYYGDWYLGDRQAVAELLPTTTE